MSIQIEGKIKTISSEGLLVSIEDQGACHSCALLGFCHEKQVLLRPAEVTGSETVEEGDAIRLSYGKIIRHSSLLYLLPLTFIFISLFLQNLITPGLIEIFQILLACGALLCGFIVVYFRAKRSTGQPEFAIEKIR